MRFTLVLSAFLLATLIPTMAWSGAEGPSCKANEDDNANLVHPVYDILGYSGINSLASLGYAKGFNMLGTAPVDPDGFKLPRVDQPDTEGILPVVKLMGGVGTGFPDMDGNGITDQVIVNSSSLETMGAFPDDDGDGVTNPAYEMLPSLPPNDYRALGFPDLDGDGSTDYCVQHIASGYSYCYGMSGSQIIWEGKIPRAVSGYITLGFPDLDGVNGQDVCLQSTASGKYTYCYIIEVALTEGAALPAPTWSEEGSIPSPSGYESVGFPQLTAEGAREYCVRAPGGYTYCYEFDTSQASSSTDAFFIDKEGSIPGPPSSSYTTVGFPQLDKANGDDTCIRHTAGYTVCYTAPADWTAKGSWTDGVIPNLESGYTGLNWPDLNCDERQDYVVQHDTSKYTVAYLMNGLTAGPAAGGIPPADGDYTTKPWAINGKDVLPQLQP